MPSRQFGWLDSPDGEDIIKKTSIGAKVGFIVGMPIAIFDHFMNRQQTMKGYGFRAACCILPVVGAGAAFGLVSQALCQKYPKTPELWYAVGGAAGASVLGGAARSGTAGTVLAFYFGITAYLVRDMVNFQGATGGYFGHLPTTLQKSDIGPFSQDWRIDPQPITSMPPPMARPGRPHSDLGLY